ncbi:MAG: OmpA family protein [Terriglobales bacterium]
MQARNYWHLWCARLSRTGLAMVLGAGVAAGLAGAQQVKPEPTQANAQGNVPLYKVAVVGRTVTAVNFHVLGGSTTLALDGTTLLPYARGHATIEIKRGATSVHLEVDHVNPAQRFGPEYLTYVLWAITPDGRAKNLGEVQLLGQSASLNATTTLQNFGLLVTAEPYFDVSRPSDLVVMQGMVKSNTVGAEALVNAKAELLQRGSYRLRMPESAVAQLPQSPKVPLDFYEAQNAVRIAKWAGADEYADSGYRKAKAEMLQAQNEQEAHASKGEVATTARAAVESAEDARLLSLHRQQQQQMIAAQADAATQAAAASVARQEADAADSAKAQATAEASAAQSEAEIAESEREAAEARAAAAHTAALAAREKLRAQLNAVLATRETARGLIMSMSDVLFDLNKATLRPDAQVKLAKVAGILQTYPGLKIQVDGYTDSTGTPDYNQQLSEQRAAAVAAFLTSQGVSSGGVSAQGFGQADPVASNQTAAGRQQNRRVELVVNGTAIGSPNQP